MAVQEAGHAEVKLFPETQLLLMWMSLYDGLLAFLALWAAAPISEASQSRAVAWRIVYQHQIKVETSQYPPLLP
jgi:hypothetical protein